MIPNFARNFFKRESAEPAKVSKASDVCFVVSIKATPYTAKSDSSEFFVQGVPRKVLVGATKNRKSYFELWFAGSLRIPRHDRTDLGFYDVQLCFKEIHWERIRRSRADTGGITAMLFSDVLFPGNDGGKYPVQVRVKREFWGAASKIQSVRAGKVHAPSQTPVFSFEEMVRVQDAA
jgi:hypothetical protein